MDLNSTNINSDPKDVIDYIHAGSATVDDVARRAGVSTATVSRALNDSPSVREETKARVEAAAREIGYVMHRHARALRSQRTNTISVHLPIPRSGDAETLANPFYLEFLSAVGSALHHAGLDMLVSHAATVDLDLHRTAQVDGYIQVGRGRNPGGLRELAQAGVPLAVWAPPDVATDYCAVGVDNVALAHDAVSHLVADGRRRIAVITGDLDDTTSEGYLRFAGYRRALEDAGLDADESLIGDLTSMDASGVAAARMITQANPEVDAVFVAAGDSTAIAVIRSLQDLGRSVPEDVAVVGFDNIQLGEFTHPRLTTVDQGLAQGVPILVDRVIRQIDGRPASSQKVTGRVVARESCGGTHGQDT
jgi:DNA-binding LacI/PurR family transcriptional regulator